MKYGLLFLFLPLLTQPLFRRVALRRSSDADAPLLILSYFSAPFALSLRPLRFSFYRQERKGLRKERKEYHHI